MAYIKTEIIDDVGEMCCKMKLQLLLVEMFISSNMEYSIKLSLKKYEEFSPARSVGRPHAEASSQAKGCWGAWVTPSHIPSPFSRTPGPSLGDSPGDQRGGYQA